MIHTEVSPLKRSSSRPLRLGIAGLGTVGIGVIRLLRTYPTLITDRTGRPFEVVAISARNRQRDRGEDLSTFRWYDDPLTLAHDPDIDVVVELIGGANDPAHALVSQALENGKSVVTANKALIAQHGNELARLSAAKNAPLYYEAAVAGVVPAVKVVREALAGDQLTQLGGILNGTCNFILSTMEETGRTFDDVLKEAQDKGYAEADPSTDVDGWDTAHKLAILTGIAFQPIAFESLNVQGIRAITAADLAFTKELGYCIKLLGIAHRRENGGVEASVQPCLVPLSAGLAHVGGAFNAVSTNGPFSGPVTLSGQGAGEGPTAAAVVADLIDLGRGHQVPLWGRIPPAQVIHCHPVDEVTEAFYLRLSLSHKEQADTLIKTLRQHGIDLQDATLRTAADHTPHLIAMTAPVLTHTLRQVLHDIADRDKLASAPLALKIETLS